MAMLKGGTTFDSLHDYIGVGKGDRKIGNNTHAIFNDGESCVDIVLHSTIIVKIYFDGRMKFNVGGWPTVTTKDRINHFLGNRGTLRTTNHVLYYIPTGASVAIEVHNYTWYDV